MNNGLRYALIISVLIHFILITPLYGFSIFKEAMDIKKPMVVDYVIIKDPKNIDIRRSISPQKAPQAVKTDISKNAAVKTSSGAAGSAALRSRKVSPGDSRIARKTEAKIRATRDYVSYYQLIRGQIRDSLKRNYKVRSGEGYVRVMFTLAANGSLVSVEADEPGSTNDKTLLDVSVRSVKDAAPFPAFPKALSLPKMTFDLVMNFKRQ
jgi:outer membrane biosynthesis protein TonB